MEHPGGEDNLDHLSPGLQTLIIREPADDYSELN